MEVPLHSHVRVTHACGGLGSQSPKDDEVGSIHIQLQVVGQTVVEFEVGGVLPQTRVLRMLESVKFIEELKVPLPSLGNQRVVRVERQLSRQPLRGPESYRAAAIRSALRGAWEHPSKVNQ